MIIGIGETILDIIFKNDQPQAAVPGGSTFNAIISLGRTGVPCTIVTETGDDHVGDIVCNYLADNGVDTTYVNCRQGTKSHVSLAFLDENNDAQYQFYKDHASARISDNMPTVTANDIVIFGSFFAINPVIRKEVYGFLKKAHDSGAILYYDINFRASHIADIPDTIENIKQNMGLSTIVRGSLEDFGYLYGLHDVDEIYQQHIRKYCPCFICTNGGKPVELRTPAVSASFESPKVETVSTIGAGDNFNAGFVFGIHRSNNTTADSTQPPHPITAKDFAQMPVEAWKPLIKSAHAFSSHVCASIYNSVCKGFRVESIV